MFFIVSQEMKKLGYYTDLTPMIYCTIMTFFLRVANMPRLYYPCRYAVEGWPEWKACGKPGKGSYCPDHAKRLPYWPTEHHKNCEGGDCCSCADQETSTP